MNLTGFDESELAYLTANRIEGLTDPDAVPEVPENPVTKPGDLWILGRHRLLCGDATFIDQVKRLFKGVEPILMVTDPPYGVDYDPKWRTPAILQVKIPPQRLSGPWIAFPRAFSPIPPPEADSFRARRHRRFVILIGTLPIKEDGMTSRIAFWVTAALVIVTLAIIVGAQTQADLPPGVRAESWVPINDHAGVALNYVGPSSVPNHGTLWIKSHGGWAKVYLDPAPEGRGFVPVKK